VLFFRSKKETVLKCAKCEKVVDVETYQRFHGCCSAVCDEDEGIAIMLPISAKGSGQEAESVTSWKAREAQAQEDLQRILTDADAIAFLEKYLSKELCPNLLKMYRSDRHEMGRTPRQAIDHVLSLPPL